MAMHGPIIEYMHKLRYGKITEAEAKILYSYLKLNGPGELRADIIRCSYSK